jgi:hypothetical protein
MDMELLFNKHIEQAHLICRICGNGLVQKYHIPQREKEKNQRKMMASDYNWGEIPAFGERTHLKHI